MPHELLTIEDAAERLKILPIELRHLLQAKKLAAIQINSRQWRISATDLQEFINRGTAKGE